MVDEFRTQLENYFKDWQLIVDERVNSEFFTALKPTALGWKFTDRDEVMARFAEIRDLCDQVHFGWINERWVICVHFKELVLPGDITIVKLMERRPGSEDPVGLDHVDFYTTANSKEVVELEEGLDWNEEHNGDHCKWISVWFEGGEAKLRSDTVLQVCADEMLEVQDKVLKK